MNNSVNQDTANSEFEKSNNVSPDNDPQTSPEAGNSTNSQQDSGNVVRNVRELLGQDVVLIPVVRGEKKPAIDGWQKVTIERMSDPAYLRQLEGMNIGVVLGTASGGLCAIDIDHDAEVEPFLNLNPTLRSTLRSKGARGCQIWVRMTGDFYKLTKLKTKEGEEWGEWRADGGQSVIHGRHPSGVDYSVLHEAKPLEIAFESIKWPEHLKLPWVKTDAAVVEERDGEPFVITDRGTVIVNQMYFVRKYTLEYHVLYDAGVSDFYQYDPDSGLWKRVTVESIKRAFLDDFATVARTANLPQVFLKRTDGFVNGLVALLKSTAEKCNAFTERPHAIHVKNGMICFDDEGATLKTFHPDYLSRNQCPHAFDPQADCPRFIKELLESAMSRDDASLLQRWAGACLLGHNAAQRFLMLLGTPGGGKSTVMAIIEQMIGLQNVAQLRTEQLSERFELYSFVGKQLLIGKDVSSNFLMQKGAYMLKALVGHDTLEAEKKNANERIKINGDFNVGITCNADLNIRLQGDAGAWRRRMMVIRYENEPPKKRIPDFAEQLLAQEGPGILKWMVEGAMDLLDDLEQYGDYYLTDPQKEQINRLMDQSDSVRRFVQEGVVPRKGASITTEDLISAYYEFCDNRQWAPFPVRELRAGLAKYMLEIHRLNSRNDIPRGEKVARGFKHVAVVNGGLE